MSSFLEILKQNAYYKDSDKAQTLFRRQQFLTELFSENKHFPSIIHHSSSKKVFPKITFSPLVSKDRVKNQI